MKAMSQFNNMIKSMPFWLKLVLILLSIIWLILLIWAAIPRIKSVEELVIMNQYQVLDSVLKERLEPSRDSLVVLYEKIVDVQSKVDSLQRELNKCIIRTEQVSSVHNKTKPLPQPKRPIFGATNFEEREDKGVNESLNIKR